MNKNNNRKLTAENYVERLSNEEELIKFLNQHEVCDTIAIKDIKAYTKDQNYQGMIITAVVENSDDPIKILIDIKIGEPSIDQVYDAIYDTGKWHAVEVLEDLLFTEDVLST
jgi:hypothetical protein